MKTHRLLALLPLLLLALGGCSKTQTVGFARHAPYPSRSPIPEPLAVVFPDGLLEKSFDYIIPKTLSKHTYQVHYGEALYHEAQARFQNTFEEVFIVEKTFFETARAQAEAGLDEMEPLQDDDNATEDSTENILLFTPDFVREKRGYILEVEAVRFIMNQGRPVVFVQSSLYDAPSGRLLNEWRTQGSGDAPAVTEATDLTGRRIREAVVSACSQVYGGLDRGMREAIEKDRGIPRR